MESECKVLAGVHLFVVHLYEYIYTRTHALLLYTCSVRKYRSHEINLVVASPTADTGLVFLKLYSHVGYIVYALNTAEKYINDP